MHRRPRLSGDASWLSSRRTGSWRPTSWPFRPSASASPGLEPSSANLRRPACVRRMSSQRRRRRQRLQSTVDIDGTRRSTRTTMMGTGLLGGGARTAGPWPSSRRVAETSWRKVTRSWMRPRTGSNGRTAQLRARPVSLKMEARRPRPDERTALLLLSLRRQS